MTTTQSARYIATVTIPGVLTHAPIVASEYPSPTLTAARAFLRRALPNHRVGGSMVQIRRDDGKVFDRAMLSQGEWIQIP